MKKRVLSLLLAAVLLLGLMPAALAANPGGAQGVVDAAKGYLEQDYAVGSYFGGGDTDWCGRFLYRCAEDAGETAALCGSLDTLKSTLRAMPWFVTNGKQVGYFYDTIYISNYGLNASLLVSKANYTPKVGDIIFYDWDGNPTSLGHMEIVSSVSDGKVTTIGGSTGGSCTQKNWGGKYHVHAHTYDISSKYIVAYARPAYGSTSTSTSSLSINTTTKPTANMKEGSPFYFRGSITSGSSITSATVSILDANGTTVVQTKTVYPNANSVDILKGGLDDLKFGKLAVGGYYLYLTATDASGQTAEWKEPFSIGNAPLPNPTTATKTQYRYHRYIDAKGNVSLCPYYGGSLFKSTMTLQYTDWLDAPLTKNSSSSGHNHVNQGSLCTKAGCIDPSGKTERFTDGSSNWYYQETRVVAVEPTSTPTPTPTPMPESSKLPLSFIKTYPSGMYWDVSSDDWFYSNVVDAYELGLMVGLNATTFAPNDNVTVAQAITMAARIHSLYHTGSMGFPVYDGGNWYDPYVDYALTNGLVARGDLLDRFLSMDRAATREEFVYILARALPESELQPIADISFTDEESIYYRTSVRLLSRAGIINGYTQYGLSYFDPTGYITRAQAAAIIGRMSRPGTRVGG